MLVLGGLVGLVLSVVPLRTGDDTRLPVPPDTAVRLPSVGAFGTTLVLYGRAGDQRPEPGELGCEVTDEDGDDVGLKVSTLRALGAGERIVGNESLAPLATVRGFDTGWLFTCTGPAARTAQPLYLLSERRRTVPRAVIAPFSVLCLALGAGALVLARRSSPAER